MSQDWKKELDAMFQDYTDTMKAMHEASAKKANARANELQEQLEKTEADIAEKIGGILESQQKDQARLIHLEQQGVKPVNTLEPVMQTVGQTFVDSEAYLDAAKRKNENTGKVIVGAFPHQKGATAIVNATGQNQPLVPDDRLNIPIVIDPAMRRMTIRNLIPGGRTDSNLIQFVKENVFTNSAAPQYVSPDLENVAKAESGITFTLENEPVQTIAHWIPASRQVLSDSPMLRSHIDTRLMYGLKLEEESQLLSGDGTGGNLNGLITQATAYNTGLDVANDTKVDQLRHAILQVTQSEYMADGIVLNPADWHTIELLKVNPGTDDRYIWADPQSRNVPRLWGLPVVETQSQTSGEFLVANFAMSCQIFDRWDATIEVANQHSDYFTKNMIAILCEERLALVVYRPLALVEGSFT